ncbi:MAG: hypothetical protein ACTSWY_11700 [Promethearchaeota archaeon]
MKGYCPKCHRIIDETEYMQYRGVCANCAEIKKKIGLDERKIRKETGKMVIEEI